MFYFHEELVLVCISNGNCHVPWYKRLKDDLTDPREPCPREFGIQLNLKDLLLSDSFNGIPPNQLLNLHRKTPQ